MAHYASYQLQECVWMNIFTHTHTHTRTRNSEDNDSVTAVHKFYRLSNLLKLISRLFLRNDLTTAPPVRITKNIEELYTNEGLFQPPPIYSAIPAMSSTTNICFSFDIAQQVHNIPNNRYISIILFLHSLCL